MPTAVAQITLALSYQAQAVSIPLDNHWLTSASLINISQDSRATQTWAFIGLAQGAPAFENLISVLAQGYLGGSSSLFWTGKLIADPDTLLFAHIFGTAGQQFRLISVVNKVIEYKKGLILVDP